MKAVILAAGKGKRMRGLCSTTPKPMIPIANRPILSIIFSRLKAMGVNEVALVVGFEGQQLKKLVGDGSEYGVHVTYVWQEEQLGTGHATLLCEDFVAGESFVLIFGDILTRGDNYAAMAELFHSSSADAVLTVFSVEDPSNGAAVDVQDGRVVGIVEKPPPGTMLNAYNNAGIFIWPADIFDMIRHLELSPRGEYEFTDGIITFVNQGRRLAAYELLGYWENITDPEACIRMNQNLLLEFLPPASPVVDPSAQTGEALRLSNCSVAAGAAIGADCRLEDSTIGEGCRIGDGVSVKHAEIGPDAVIGDGCRLAPYVSIGEGAVVESGASVGPNTAVGARCVVRADASVASTIMLDGSEIGAGSSLVHTMLAYDAKIAAGEKITGAPDKAVELLNDP